MHCAEARGCLTALQVDVLKKIYAGPTDSKGEKLFPGPLPGSEIWSDWFSAPPGKSSIGEVLATEAARYLMFMPDFGPHWQLGDFDFDRDYKRLGMMQSLYSDTNPDLRKFKAAGGKLIAYHG